MLKARLDADMKTAMLAGDKTRVSTLKMLKSAMLYKEVELGVRDVGLTDEQIIDVFTKEAKKRLEAAELYTQAGNTEKSAAETAEHAVVSEYLPQQMSDEELEKTISSIVTNFPDASVQQMGQIIGAVKSQVGANADGARIAQMVKQKLSA